MGGGQRPTMGARLAGEDIICFSHTPWRGPWKASQQIMSLLAESNRVFYVGPPITLRDAINSFRGKAPRLPMLERPGPTLFIYHEPGWLARIRDDRPLGRPYNRAAARCRALHARHLARRLGFKNPILWVFDPMQSHAVGLFQEKLVVYHVLDNYVEFARPDETSLRAVVAHHEERMLELADLVFAVSRSLHERCLKRNPKSFLVPNGVDFGRFQTAIAAGTPPSDMQEIRRPIIGYVGVIQGDLDFPLLDRLAGGVPDASIVLVGPADLSGHQPKFEALLASPNVHYLGAKPVQDVPRYINACDVCILPSSMNGSAADSDQIKVYEYLACGRPIVSTDLPSVRRFSEVVRIARNADEFLAQVKASLDADAGLAEQRRRIASEQSWQHRVMALSEAVMQTISTRRTRQVGAHR
jgi:glycosyltransferase involved in cell wall biosynthesis